MTININDLIYQYPDREWDWDRLSENSSLSFDTIIATYNMPWNWDKLSGTFDKSVILQYPDSPWNVKYLVSTKKITLGDLLIIAQSGCDWNWYETTGALFDTIFKADDHSAALQQLWEHIRDIVNCQWNWSILSDIFNLPNDLSIITSNIDCNWNWRNVFVKFVTINKEGLYEFIASTRHRIQWDWQVIQYHNTSSEFIGATSDMGWDWDLLSRASYINHLIVTRLPGKSWDWDTLSKNQSVASVCYLSLPDKPWNWDHLSSSVAFRGVEDFGVVVGAQWNWHKLSRNPSITSSIVMAYPDAPWDWAAISSMHS